MNRLSPQTRALLDDLRSVDEPSPSQVDHAWRRFERRQQSHRRRTVVLWLGLGAAAAVAVVLLVPSLRSTVLGRRDGAAPTEAPAQVEERTSEGTAKTTSPASAATPGLEPAPADDTTEAETTTEPAPQPEPSSASSERPASRSRSRSTETTSEPEPTPPSAASIAAELRLLDAAERALRDGDLDEVERRLEQHRQRFAAGALVEERRTLAQQLRARRDGSTSGAANRSTIDSTGR